MMKKDAEVKTEGVAYRLNELDKKLECIFKSDHNPYKIAISLEEILKNSDIPGKNKIVYDETLKRCIINLKILKIKLKISKIKVKN